MTYENGRLVPQQMYKQMKQELISKYADDTFE